MTLKYFTNFQFTVPVLGKLLVHKSTSILQEKLNDYQKLYEMWSWGEKKEKKEEKRKEELDQLELILLK